MWKKIILSGSMLMIAFAGTAQDDKKIRKDTTLHFVDTSSVNKKDPMPVAKPDKNSPVIQMPNKRIGENEDGMPVKTIPDSTMNKHK